MRYLRLSPGDLSMQEGAQPQVHPGTARIRVVCCGVCGTDVHMLHGMRLPAGSDYPVRPGHEVAGIVEQIDQQGEQANDLALGDLVVLHPLAPCGVCASCRAGEEQVCADVRILGIDAPGGLAEQVVWPFSRIVRATGIEPAVAAVLADAGATAYRAVRAAQLQAGASVCVIGAGGVGTQVVKIARALYPGIRVAAIVGSQPSADRLAFPGVTVELGVSRAARRVGNDFDAVIEFSGRPEAPAEGMRMLRAGGRLVLGSLIHAELQLGPAVRVQTRELELVGVFSSTIGDLRAVVDLYRSGKIDPAGSVSHREPFANAVGALEAVDRGLPGLVRMVLDVSDP